MSQHFNKYKSAWTALMVACYLAGGVQFPLLECLHFFSHLGDYSNNHAQHSYQSHGDDHAHTALQVLEAVSGGANGRRRPPMPPLILN